MSVILELAVDADLPPRLPRAQRITLLKQRADEARRGLLQRIEALRARDPQIQVRLQNTIFPVLEVESTQEVIDELAHEPGVLRVSPSPEFQMDHPSLIEHQ